MTAYVIVYVGYEGIDHILSVVGSPEEAAKEAHRYQEIATTNSLVPREERKFETYPQHTWVDPDRICVMTKKSGGKTYECCCSDCGLTVDTPILY